MGIGITDPKSRLDINGGIKIAGDSAAASADKAGTLRYRGGNPLGSGGYTSYLEICMETSPSTYAWVILMQCGTLQA